MKMTRPPALASGASFILSFGIHAQALAKIERGHEQDISDVREMGRLGLIRSIRLVEFFESIEPTLVRYPAIDPLSFRNSVLRVARTIVS